MSDSIRRLRWTAILLIFIVGLGTVGYSLLEKWGLLDSLWMTVITMSTVGFGEVSPMTASGKIFTIILISSTVLIGGYTIGNISAFLVGGEIGAILKGRRMEKTISKLKDHVVLVGYGAVGFEAALAWDTNKLIILEKDSARYEKALEHGYFALCGDAADEETLLSGGLKKASGIMIAVGLVADTILIALTAKEINPNVVISARIDDVHAVSKLKKIGVTNVVLPSQIGGRRLAAFLKQPAIVDFLDLVMGNDDLSLKLEEVTVEPGCSLDGKSLKESNIRKNTGGALVMSVYQPRGQHNVAPSPEYVIKAGDKLILLGTDESLNNACGMAS